MGLASAVEVADRTVDGLAGPVPIRVYRPATPTPIAGLLWIHGGGFGMGDLDMPEADAVSRALAVAGVAVVSTHYRLAVDGVHFPACSDDVLAVWRWVVETAELPPVTEGWSIGGGSAGANLAASVCLQARDLGVELPRRAVLVYAALHAEIPEPSPELAEKLVRLEADRRITSDIARSIALAYVGDEALLRHPYAFPAEGVLDGFPPTLILNSDLDSLRASGEAFGAQLVTAGVDTTVLRMVGAEHAFLNDPDLPAFELGIERIAHWLQCPVVGVAHERLPQ